jgi:uracil-DNA glycosylase
VGQLFNLLTRFQGEGVFNQYRDVRPEFDLPHAADVRWANLCRYLEIFSDAAYVLVGEAAGYAGCRFSGIPFTGEAQLVGPECLPWACDGGFAQSSNGQPWRERSGTIVWETLGQRRDCVLWNAFPWHPFGEKPLSNRRPRQAEMAQAREVLLHFLSLFPQAEVHAIGRVSQQALSEIGIDAGYIRHPSHGGKAVFRQGLAALPVVGGA